MKGLLRLYKIEWTLAVREFSGVLFGLLLPLGILFLLGSLPSSAPGASYTRMQQAVPALITTGICASALMGLPLTIASYREKGLLKSFRVTPGGPALILAAQLLSGLTLALLSSLLSWAGARLFFGYRLQGPLLPFLGAYLLVLLSHYAIGLLLAALSGSVKTANLLCSLVYFPLFFLSGATVPFELFPPGLQKAASLMPLTQGIKLLKAIALNRSGFSPAGPVILLGATTLICAVLSLKFFRWD